MSCFQVNLTPRQTNVAICLLSAFDDSEVSGIPPNILGSLFSEIQYSLTFFKVRPIRVRGSDSSTLSNFIMTDFFFAIICFIDDNKICLRSERKTLSGSLGFIKVIFIICSS